MTQQLISSLMQRDVAKASLDDTIGAIEATMASRKLSWMPVEEPGGAIIGVISSSDLLRFHADGKDAGAVRAWQLCTYRPITVGPDATLSEVARLMVRTGIHHVVVTDLTGMCGVVSSLDFVRTFIEPA